MRRLIIAAGVVVVLMISAIALVVINANDTATALQTETTEPESDVSLPEFMEERLQDLVERGFVTQEQLDEMEGRFREHGPWNGELPEGFDPKQFMGPGFGRHGFGFFGGDEDLMGLLGVTPDEIMDALAEGTPLNDIIEDPEAFVDALVGIMEEGLNQAVEEGHLTQAEADDLLAEARTHAEAFINGEGLKGEGFMGPRGPRGFGGFGEFGPHKRSDADTAGYSA